jgi:hypothetical protein
MSGRTIEELFFAPEFLPARIAMRKAARAALLGGAASAPPELLHFTDLDGLVGIVEKGALWATYAHALNDESEIRYGIEQVRKGHPGTGGRDAVCVVRTVLARVRDRPSVLDGDGAAVCGVILREGNERTLVALWPVWNWGSDAVSIGRPEGAPICGVASGGVRAGGPAAAGR